MIAVKTWGGPGRGLADGRYVGRDRRESSGGDNGTALRATFLVGLAALVLCP